MGKRVVLIGCGNIGSYHLQALAGLPGDFTVEIVEPNPESVQRGKERIKQRLMERTGRFDIEWLDSIDKVSSESDLSIVATHATGRVDILEVLLKKGHKRFLIEKVVCQSTEEYKRLLALMKNSDVNGWVNCCRRYNEFYRMAAELFHGSEGPLVFEVKGGNWGLACNAIHFIDMFCWFTGCGDRIELDGSDLLGELLENNRGKELLEFAGTITGRTERGDSLSVSSIYDNNSPVSVNVLTEDTGIWVDESGDKAFVSKNRSSGVREERPFRLGYTSEITAEIVRDIFSCDDCGLPRVEDMFIPHKQMFEIFNLNIEKVTNSKVEICPIT